jgi:hypothetical protein
MSIKSKVLGGAAALAVMAGGLGVAGAATAHAATPSCGHSCIELSAGNYGTGNVVDVYKAKQQSGAKVVLWAESNTDKAEDFTVSYAGRVNSLYNAGLVAESFAYRYGHDLAFELQYTPDGVDSGLCVGTATKAGSGTPVVLEPCGASSKTVWALDTHGVSASQVKAHYVQLINGSNTNFAQPYVLTNRSGSLVTNNALGFAQGFGTIANDNQIWTANWGVAF